MNDNDRKGFAGPGSDALPLQQPEQRASSAGDVAGRATACFDIFSAEPGDSDVTSQMERLSSKETKIAARLDVDGGRRVVSVSYGSAWSAPQ